jgi:hypothetical protein
LNHQLLYEVIFIEFLVFIDAFLAMLEQTLTMLEDFAAVAQQILIGIGKGDFLRVFVSHL